MSHYSDPTAARGLSGINREFARLEARARRIRQRLEEGKISPEQLERERAHYRGIYRHVLDFVLREEKS